MKIAPTTLPRLWLILLAVLALFYSLGGRGLNEPDEGRFAEIGREMAVTGDWLTPKLNGVPHLPKPPLTYWLIGLSIRTLGATEFAARLPAALAGLATLVALYLLARSALGEEAGWLSVLVLLSSPLFFVIARLVTTDMLLTCFVTWSVWSLWRWYDSADRGWRRILWFYVFLGLGLLTKGPVAVVLPLMALAGLRWGNPDLALRKMWWARGLLVVLVIAVPWFVAVAGTNVEIWKYFLGREMLGRVVSSVHRREEPWWYFIPVIAGGMLFWLPWLTSAPVVLRDSPQRQLRITRLCLAWAGLGLILFTLSRSKLATYALPLLPPLAVLTAVTLSGFARRLAAGRDFGWALAAGVGSLISLCACVAVLSVVSTLRFQMPPFAWWPAWVWALVVVLVSIWLLLGKKVLPVSVVLGVGVTGLFLILAGKFAEIESQLPNSAPLNHLGRRILAEDPNRQASVIAYHNLPPGLVFYVGRPVLWFQDYVAERSERDRGVFEYRSPQTEISSVITNEAQVATVLTGSERVFCVVKTRDAAEIAKRFSLVELTRYARYALLSNRPLMPAERIPIDGQASAATPTPSPAQSH